VECDMSCQHPRVKQMTVDNSDARATIKGKLFYEGAIPEGHLIFLAPLDDDGFSVVIFDVK